jgi:hypothetical protein
MEVSGVVRRGLADLLDQLPPDRELENYCSREPERLLPRHDDWPPAWNKLLKKIYKRNKFESKMAEVWINQKLGRTTEFPDRLTPAARERDWSRPWWQKERREALLTQIASDCRQRRLYGGWDILMTLSGSNILVFVNLCREIWDIWERAQLKAGHPLKSITSEIQSQAIRVVADFWLQAQEQYPGGAERRDFITRLGIGIRKALLADRGLVYPGHTGFSLLNDEYDSKRAEKARHFLEEATDFGTLIALPHTTKEKDRRPRTKWYLFPALCPHFDIPAIRTKEPYYATLEELQHWLSPDRPAIEFRRPGERRRPARRGTKGTKVGGAGTQGTLFDETGGASSA